MIVLLFFLRKYDLLLNAKKKKKQKKKQKKKKLDISCQNGISILLRRRFTWNYNVQVVFPLKNNKKKMFTVLFAYI